MSLVHSSAFDVYAYAHTCYFANRMSQYVELFHIKQLNEQHQIYFILDTHRSLELNKFLQNRINLIVVYFPHNNGKSENFDC